MHCFKKNMMKFLTLFFFKRRIVRVSILFSKKKFASMLRRIFFIFYAIEFQHCEVVFRVLLPKSHGAEAILL